ncbi:sugar phosphate nucleotidyltransferase [Candidatus Pelagibacter sp. HIMB1321]|uniref:sugar phosphate nucleotidyltransferase n=1 Tax=Candidatus Pelagibacter sp. HIMB1321 TaxID=1388755 RepID=UPI000A07E646|nr:sugar phosphate nucleotidyltransferase [Candidatus Pelagibacter sp. HIMB1321]SMF79612.1 Nucleoside-diphosphate-sugar pyrophosphorylase involved in lipopolysaccharide biosynthesis/translation initiation factor 2B, gamma/epsilon subunits (eIF-2Bgamma/eIF-2Bepsilon) [Candidatus Pelagibacter sp. HIMB1321]
MTYKTKYLLDIDIKKTFIKLHETINDALKSLNNSNARICIVVDKKNFFKGVLNDGDIRRALLKGKNLTTKISNIYNKKPIVLNKNFDEKNSIKKLKENNLDNAPIVDNKKVIGIFNANKPIIKKNLEMPVVIMSGGKGSRLKPTTIKIPKALVRIKKTPMLTLVINNLRKYGFFNFILTTFYKKNLIKNYYGNGKKLNIDIKYVNEKKPLGTAGSLSLLKNMIKNKFFLLTNCDVISEINYKSLLEFHIKNKADLTIAVKKYVTENHYGEINISGINVRNIVEKPKKNIIINSGIYILNSKIIKILKYHHYIDMNELIMKLIKKNKKVIAFPFYENWFDLGTKEQLKIYKSTLR